MSTRTVVLDDLDQSEGATTIRFGLGYTAYEVDLAEVNTDKLEKALAPFIQVAREVVKRGPTTNSQASLIREWAATKGIEVNQKGRIPSEIAEQYEADQAA